ncbi:MAG: hypothetical protein GXY77_16100 [Fibrobacter sp.]|nr:hypothetical protein [Fibrobacter sp.]
MLSSFYFSSDMIEYRTLSVYEFPSQVEGILSSVSNINILIIETSAIA